MLNVVISQTVLDYNQIVWIRLAHRLGTDFQYFFYNPWQIFCVPFAILLQYQFHDISFAASWQFFCNPLPISFQFWCHCTIWAFLKKWSTTFQIKSKLRNISEVWNLFRLLKVQLMWSPFRPALSANFWEDLLLTRIFQF